jgi:ankyrin repeat protein
MNEKLLQLLEGREELYPILLEKEFPRILNRILQLWDSPEIDHYFNELLIDSRGDRQGFPPRIASEIIQLNLANARYKQHPVNANDVWETSSPISKETIEKHGIPVMRKSLMEAAESNDIESLHHLLQTGKESLNTTDERHWTPLIVAAFNGHDLATRILLEAGADTKAQDKSGYTALHWAAYNGQSRTVNLLLQERADVNARSHSGWTPLMQAAARGQTAVVLRLLSHEADVDLQADDGATALIKAAANGHLDIVKMLLQKQASTQAQLKDGSTALALATRNGHGEIAALLEPLS